MYLQTAIILAIAVSLVSVASAQAQTLFTTKHFVCVEKTGLGVKPQIVCVGKAGLSKSGVVTFTTKNFVCVSTGGKPFVCTHK